MDSHGNLAIYCGVRNVARIGWGGIWSGELCNVLYCSTGVHCFDAKIFLMFLVTLLGLLSLLGAAAGAARTAHGQLRKAVQWIRQIFCLLVENFTKQPGEFQRRM